MQNEKIRDNLEQDFTERKRIVRFLENEGFPVYGIRYAGITSWASLNSGI